MMHASTLCADAPVRFVLPPSVLVHNAGKLIIVGNSLAIVEAVGLSEGPHRFVYSDGAVREGSPTLRRLNTPDTLACHGLALLKVEEKPKTIIGFYDWNAFTKAIILHETQALERFMELVLAHCAKRVIGDRRLSAFSSIRLRLAETSQLLTLAREMAGGTGANLSPVLAKEITALVYRATDLLIKTAGARSMLGNGLVETRFVFTLFNNIYLCS